MKTNYT